MLISEVDYLPTSNFFSQPPPLSSPLPTNSLLDDIFSDSPSPSPSPGNVQTNDQPSFHHPSEIPRLRATHTTAGYRDGISASKTAALQPGFDEGYSLGAVLGLRVGYLLGIMEGLCAALQKANASDLFTLPRTENIIVNPGVGQETGSNQGQSAEELHECESLILEARRDLDLGRIFSKEVWTEKGTWGYNVSGKDGEDITFEEIADQHPTIRKWRERIEGIMHRFGIEGGIWEGDEWEKGRIDEG